MMQIAGRLTSVFADQSQVARPLWSSSFSLIQLEENVSADNLCTIIWSVGEKKKSRHLSLTVLQDSPFYRRVLIIEMYVKLTDVAERFVAHAA